MVSDNKEKFRIKYQAGKKAFEGGKYRLSVELFQAASKLIAPNSRLGGETSIWLVTAYQAAGLDNEAIALCTELTTHPYPKIREQSQRLLYIIKAPQLKRPREWMSEIPDLATLSESEVKFRRGSGVSKSKKSKEEEPIDLSQVNTQDNQFIWVGLLAILVTLGSLFWFS